MSLKTSARRGRQTYHTANTRQMGTWQQLLVATGNLIANYRASQAVVVQPSLPTRLPQTLDATG